MLVMYCSLLNHITAYSIGVQSNILRLGALQRVINSLQYVSIYYNAKQCI